MARKLSLIGVLILLILLSVPYLVGIYSKSQIEEDVEELQEALKQYDMVSVKLLDHKLGWRHSTSLLQISFSKEFAQFLISLTEPAQGPKDATFLNKFKGGKVHFTLRNDIQHGPIVKHQGKWKIARTLAVGRLELDDRAKSILTKLLGTDELFTTETLVAFDGTVDWNMNGKPLALLNQNQEQQPFWYGMDARMQLQANNDSLNLHWHFPGANIVTDSGAMIWKDLLYQSSLQPGLFGIWVGRGNVSLKELALQTPMPPAQLRLQDITLNGNSSFRNQLFFSQGMGRVERLQIDDDIYGPFYYQASLRNFDIAPFIQLQDKYGNLQTATPTPELMRDIEVLMPDFLKKNPAVKLENLFLRTPFGDFVASMQLDFDYPENRESFDPMLMLAYMIIDTRVTMTPNLYDRLLTLMWEDANRYNPAAERLTSHEKNEHMLSFKEKATKLLTQNKLLVFEQNEFSSHFHLEKEQPVLNGVLLDPSLAQMTMIQVQQAATVKPPAAPAQRLPAPPSTSLPGQMPPPKPLTPPVGNTQPPPKPFP